METSPIASSSVEFGSCLTPEYPVFPKPAASVACHRVFLDFLMRFHEANVGAEYTKCARRIQEEFRRANDARARPLFKLELHVSGNASALLNELCSKAHLPLQCVHQLATWAPDSSKGTHRANIGLLNRPDDSVQPDDSGYLGAVEIKLDAKQASDSKFQLIAYLVGMHNSWRIGTSFPVLVGAVMTSGGLSVYGALAQRQLRDNGNHAAYMAWVPLADVSWSDAKAAHCLYAFLEAVADCAQYRRRLLPMLPIEPEPAYHVLKELNKSVFVLQGARERIVCKVYDYHPLLRDRPMEERQRLRPNIDIIREHAAGYLHDVRLETCGPDVQLLYYAYIDGTHVPPSYRHLVAACEALQVLHDAGIVHGDIRIANILYYDDKNGAAAAALIDFDFAGKDGADRYLLSMMPILERAPDAMAGGLMHMAHDAYSMWFVVDFFCDTTGAVQLDRRDLARSWSG
jgi:hypothetical protein